MEEIEDGWTSADDSEDERDIEIALYSQIHFDPVPEVAEHKNENYNSLNTENQRFSVGVEEISLPFATNFNEKTPVDDESHQQHYSRAKRLSKLNKEHKAMDAIYITSSDEDDYVELVSSDEQSVQEVTLLELNESNEFDTVNDRSLVHGTQSPINRFSSDTPCLNASEEKVTSEDESMKSDSIEDFDTGDMLILDAYLPPEDSPLQKKSSKNLHSSSYENINQSHVSKQHTIYVQDDENVYSKSFSEVSSHSRKTIKTSRESSAVLPFSITKAPVNVEKESLSGDSDSICEDAETEKADLAVQNLTPTALKQNFLKFSKTGQREDSSRIELKKKKKLSKQEAAVKPRTPPVYVRKPPVVKVSYHQDSDTNTDYSDSDISFTSTPTKKPVSRSKATTSKKVGDDNIDSSQNESSSSEKTDTKSVNSKSTSSRRVKLKITSTKTDKRYSTVKKTQKCVNRDMGNKGPTSEESDTDSDVSSHGAGLEEDAAHDPALDFNLEGGVDALLKRKPVDDPSGRWQIIDKDRYLIPVNTSRYFNPFSLTCRNCNEEGHKAIECPKPKKSLCIFCGRTGHVFQACPDSICYNCSAPGHRLSECVERPINWRRPCDRCWMSGHFEEDCPDQWRQFHLTHGTANNGRAKAGSKKRSNPKVFCYNCGQEGHFGYSCKDSMMNHRIVPNYPFIAKYKNGKCKEGRSEMAEKEKKVSKKEKSKTTKYDKKFEHSREYRKKAYQQEDRETSSSKRKDKDSKFKSPKAKDSFHKEDNKKTSKSPSHKNKRHRDSKKDRSEIGESPGDGRDSIVTNTTVFSFQNTSTDYYAEEDYSPPKKRSVPETHNETAGYPLRRDHPPNFKERKSKQSRQHLDENSEDEMMHHQVFDNEWWNADNGSANKKRRKKKNSRGDAASTSQHGSQHTDNKNSQYGHGNQRKIHRREMTDHQETQNIQVTIHTSQRSDSTADYALCRRMQRRKEHFKSVYCQNRVGKKKTGFQMDSQFRSLSKSCKNNR